MEKIRKINHIFVYIKGKIIVIFQMNKNIKEMNLYKKNIFNQHTSNTFFIIFLIFIFFAPCFAKNVEIKKLILDNEIALTIKGIGDKVILNDNIVAPTQIYLNDTLQVFEEGNSLYLSEAINYIRILWDSPLLDCSLMFNNLIDIINIDLSKFDSSKVITMNGMFSNCYSLTSINLNNLDTSNVIDMSSIFLECRKLQLLDLSSFNTSSVTTMEGMFHGCNSLKSLDLNNFNTSSVTNMDRMFYWCNTLESLFINNFNTSSVISMRLMFQECQLLKSLNISNFDTSSVIDINNMFYNCYSLEKLDLSNFKTSYVTNMYRLFYNCISLESLDISNFDTSSVIDMTEMFYSCSSLKYLDISNFNTSSASLMKNMFFNCYSLISLELGNLDTSSFNDMSYMFYNCSSLISLNLNSFNTLNINDFTNMFTNIQNFFKYCINDNKISEDILLQLSPFNKTNCSELCSIQSQNNFIFEKNKCIDDCSKDDTYKFEYNKKCYSSCPNQTHNIINTYLCEKDLICQKYYNYNKTSCLEEIPLGFYLNDSNAKTIDKCIIKCSNCTKESIEKDLCISCNNNENYFPKFNDSSNFESFINCYNEEQFGYFLDSINPDNVIYKPCYITCKKCNEYGNEENNKCEECISNYILNNGNCLNPIYYHSDQITINEIKLSDSDGGDETNSYINLNSYSELINLENNIGESNHNINLNSYSEMKDLENIIFVNNTFYYYQINSNLTELKKKYKNLTFFYFPPEEISFIYTKYNLDEKKDNIYVLISYYLNNDKPTINDYTFKLFLEDGKELNLSIIDEDFYTKVYTSINEYPNLTNFNYYKYFSNQGYDIYDINSNFYTDICSPAYLEKNDITLTDRKIDFYPENISLCKNNCVYDGVDIEDEKIICLCNMNTNKNYTNISNNTNLLIEEDNENFFTYLLDNINYKIFKCFELIFKFDNLKNNFAFYMAIIFFIIFIIIDFIFFLYSVPKLKSNLIKVVLKIKNKQINAINNNNKDKNKKIIFKKMKKAKINHSPKLQSNISNPNKKKEKKMIKLKNKNILKTNEDERSCKNSKKKMILKTNISYKNLKKKMILKTNTNEKSCKNMKSKIILKTNINERNINKFKNKIKNIENSNNNSKNNIFPNKIEEKKEDINEKENINELPYTQAIIRDKRNIFQILISLIIQKFEIIHFFYGDEKLKIIMIYEYIFSLLIKLFFNTLLYSDEVVSKKYHNNGKLDFVVSLTLSLISNIITSFICFCVDFSEIIEEKLDLIIEIQKRKYFYIKNIIKFFKYLKLRFLIDIITQLFIIPFIFNYIIVFCIVYSKSKVSLINNYLVSIIEDSIISIIISIIITITRKVGIVYFNRYFYNFSKYINSKF